MRRLVATICTTTCTTTSPTTPVVQCDHSSGLVLTTFLITSLLCIPLTTLTRGGTATASASATAAAVSTISSSPPCLLGLRLGLVVGEICNFFQIWLLVVQVRGVRSLHVDLGHGHVLELGADCVNCALLAVVRGLIQGKLLTETGSSQRLHSHDI